MYNTPSVCTENISHITVEKLFIDLISGPRFFLVGRILACTAPAVKPSAVATMSKYANCTAKGKSIDLVLARQGQFVPTLKKKNVHGKFFRYCHITRN